MKCVPRIDAAMSAFLKQRFSSSDAVIFALTASYINGFTVHRQSSFRQGDAFIVRLQCFTRNNHPRNKGRSASFEASTEAESSGAGRHLNCKWKIIVRFSSEHRPDNSTTRYAFLTCIESFSQAYQRGCFRSHYCLTPTVVSFQGKLSKCNPHHQLLLLIEQSLRGGTLENRFFLIIIVCIFMIH